MRFRVPGLLTNRVILGAVAFFVLVGFWEFRWKPQYRPHYELGVAQYQAGRYQEALQEFQAAYTIAPNSLDVVMMLGWAHYKVNHFEDARFFFDRALRINPNIEEARLGSAFVALETGRGTLDVDLIRQYLGNRSGDPGVRTLSAGALVKDGRWFEAAEVYRGLLTDRDYGTSSRLALEDMFGLKGTGEAVPTLTAFPPLRKPATLGVRYWAGDGAFWRRDGDQWRKFYVAGVNFGAAPPGFYPSRQPNDAAEYGGWLARAAGLNANVVRVYNLLPPAFYRAFKTYKGSGSGMVLFQQIYIGEPPGGDLYDTEFIERTRADIRHVVDALHGRGEVPPRPGLHGGIYDQDVSADVGAILLGRELEPSLVAQTNVLNAGERRHAGRYVQIASGTATEVWVARMLDYLVEYETQTYNAQRPVAFVNWPPLDALSHPTDAPVLQEYRARFARGEKNLELPTGPQDDADVEAIDEAKLTITSACTGGLFAAYHVYPHWPDFLLHEPALLAVRDDSGPNPLLAYLQQLAGRLPHPLLVAEYGASDAMGISHVHPLGWNHGGLTEREQAALLGRLARTVQAARTAGGLVFALTDEWYKRNWLVAPFQVPQDRATLWLNELNPDQRFGLIGFRTAKWKLFTGDPSAWKSEATLYRNTDRGRAAEGDPYAGARRLRSLQAAADEAFLYLRLAVDCLDCDPKQRRPDGRPHFDRASYAFTISTRPGAAGVKSLPWGSLTQPSGANFVLLLTDEGAARLLVSDNYNPYEIVPTPGIPSQTDLKLNYSLNTAPAARGSFEEITVEPNRRRYTRDGRELPPQRTSRSTLRYGIDDPASADYDSLGEWYADTAASAIVVRIPWGKLFVTDPSSRTVFAGFDNRRVTTATTEGIEIAAFALVPSGASRNVHSFDVASSLPDTGGGGSAALERFTWQTWNAVKPEAYAKVAYQEVQAIFAEQTRAEGEAGAGPARRGPPTPAR